METIRFLVQGSAEAPYEVTFQKSGDNLRSTCTCVAGQKGSHCKHRLSLLLGDVTDLVSDNADDVVRLADLLAGTDVEEAHRGVVEVQAAQRRLEAKMTLRPGGRRRSIDPARAIDVLRDDGLMRGDGGVNFFDVYDSADRYVGSVKTRQSVFNTELASLFQGYELKSVCRTDGQVHARSLGLYCFLEGSAFARVLDCIADLPHRKERLKIALRD